jgi:hypothetical protein
MLCWCADCATSYVFQEGVQKEILIAKGEGLMDSRGAKKKREGALSKRSFLPK